MSISALTYQPVLRLTVRASQDITAYHFVDFTGSICDLGEQSLGVADYDAIIGENISVITLGTAIVRAREVIENGQYVSSDELGNAKVFLAGEKICGKAIGASSNGFVKILLMQN
ncbi:MAG TPA: DUF2190 family protein [Candidatus Kapabacteria bacterium]|nr:DUF2190 family protein [Candidatus Kapabacteria bacterium]